MTFKDFPFLSSPPQTILAVCYYKTIFLLFKIVTEFIPDDGSTSPCPELSQMLLAALVPGSPRAQDPKPTPAGPTSLPSLLQRSRLAANVLTESELQRKRGQKALIPS